MKPWLKSGISVLLGLMILVTGSGVSLAKMVCVKSGYTSFYVSEPDDCCKHEHEHPPVTLEEKCCDISSMHIDALHYLISSTQNIEKTFHYIELPSFQFNFDAHSEIASAIVRTQTVPDITHTPPIRILTRTFII